MVCCSLCCLVVADVVNTHVLVNTELASVDAEIGSEIEGFETAWAAHEQKLLHATLKVGVLLSASVSHQPRTHTLSPVRCSFAPHTHTSITTVSVHMHAHCHTSTVPFSEQARRGLD